MASKQIPIDDASTDDILRFCELLQLDMGQVRSRSGYIAKLKAAREEDYIEIPEPVAPASNDPIAIRPQPMHKITSANSKSDPRVLISIARTQEPGGQDGVPVAVNGETSVIKRDVRVEVPYRLYEVLQNATRETFQQASEPGKPEGTGELIGFESMAYPVTVHRMPSEEEIAAWRAATDGELLGGGRIAA